jgi:hypothetical protein
VKLMKKLKNMRGICTEIDRRSNGTKSCSRPTGASLKSKIPAARQTPRLCAHSGLLDRCVSLARNNYEPPSRACNGSYRFGQFQPKSSRTSMWHKGCHCARYIHHRSAAKEIVGAPN